MPDPYRDSYGLALAYLDRDDDLMAEILAGYELGGAELHLLASVLSLVGLGRDADALGEFLFQVALSGAGRP